MTHGIPGIIAGALRRSDASFSQVALLLHGDGVDGGTSFVDSSSHARTPSASSNVTTATAIKKYGTASLQFTGSSSHLRYSDDTEFTIGTAEFLIEMFVRFNNVGSIAYLCGQSDTGGSNAQTSFGMRRNADNTIQGFCRDATVSVGSVTSVSTVTSGVWYYIAYGRQGTTFRLFIDAVAEGTNNPGSVTVQNSSQEVGIGCLGSAGFQLLNGNIDEFRMTVGAYRDVASIGVPTGPFPDS